MTTENKIKIEAQKQTVSNAAQEDRAYDITATFQTGDTQGGAIENGSVTQQGTNLATFSAWNGEQLNVNFNTTTERPAIMGAIEEFIADAREFLS